MKSLIKLLSINCIFFLLLINGACLAASQMIATNQLILGHFPTVSDNDEKNRIVKEVRLYCESKNYSNIAKCLNMESLLQVQSTHCGACFGVSGYQHWGAKDCVICP